MPATAKRATPLDIRSFHRYRALTNNRKLSCKPQQTDTIFISAIIFISPVCLRCTENLTKEFQNRRRIERRGFLSELAVADQTLHGLFYSARWPGKGKTIQPVIHQA
jgi:hypothetical protein